MLRQFGCGYKSTATLIQLSLTSNSTDGDIGTPLVVIDGPSGVVEVGEELILTCYATNSEGLMTQWLKNGQLLQEGRTT